MSLTSKSGSFQRTPGNKRELPFQKDLILSAIAEGGYGRKVGNFMQHGISDLLLALPGFCPVQVECKDLGQVSARFMRKLDTTVNQRDHMANLCRVSTRTVAFMAVHASFPDHEAVTFLPHHYTHVNQLAFDGREYPLTCWRVGKLYPNLTTIWHQMGVPHVGR